MSHSNLVQSPSASAFVTLNAVAARTPDGSTLFDNLTLAFGRERTGLVGRNGVGKTTLLRLVAGLDAPVQGAVSRAGSVGWLPQRCDPRPGETVAETLGAAAPLSVLRRILSGDGEAEDFDLADWTLEERLADVLASVGLTGLGLDRETGDLSGGEQTRVRLARLFLDAPDLIVLDEPTNNLDAASRELVATALERWKGGALVVSHDRDLLRRMDRIVELSSLGVSIYGGDYDLYAERKATERAAAERDLAAAQRDVGLAVREGRREQESQARRDAAGRRKAAKGGAPKILLGMMAERAENSTARSGVRTAERRREAEEALADARTRVEQVRQAAMTAPSTGLALGRQVLALDEAVWTAPDGRRILGPISLTVVGPQRIAVVGPNGAGKTTLLKMIAGLIEPTSGAVHRPESAALLDQHAALLRNDETVLEGFCRLNPGADTNAAHAMLARFLFRNQAALKTVGQLSGGERLRAALACVLGGTPPPRLLVLDEPTNHLDLDAIAAVEAALAAYDGALVVVSHDQDFLSAVGVDQTLELSGGVLTARG